MLVIVVTTLLNKSRINNFYKSCFCYV